MTCYALRYEPEYRIQPLPLPNTALAAALGQTRSAILETEEKRREEKNYIPCCLEEGNTRTTMHFRFFTPLTK